MRKNEFYADFSCFLAIKSLGSDGNFKKPVHMMRLVVSYLQIGWDLLALTGKKSYEFLKIEKSRKFEIGLTSFFSPEAPTLPNYTINSSIDTSWWVDLGKTQRKAYKFPPTQFWKNFKKFGQIWNIAKSSPYYFENIHIRPSKIIKTSIFDQFWRLKDF